MRGRGCAGRMATEAGVMHPTGMHSCLFLFFSLFWSSAEKTSVMQKPPNE